MKIDLIIFNPIYWIDFKELYELKSIDLFTKDYTYGEFIRYLKLNGRSKLLAGKSI